MPHKEKFVPEWAKKVVWYQIFPERFKNADKSNDPAVENLKGAWPHDYTSPWQVHPWNSDWYKLQPYELKNGKDIWFNIQRRRYGGDLQGIIEKLDYLKDLGIGAIYLNPIFESPSLHKYDAATYHHIDPNFGPDPDYDRNIISSEVPDDPHTWVWTKADKLFLKLIHEVHRRGMKVIIDGVFNHMGLNSWAFKDVIKNQEKSKYKNWFKIISWDDTTKNTKFDYHGWYGVKELPELNQDENGIVDGPKNYIFNITQRWMDPEGNGNVSAGIDGWRLDVAFMIAHSFWKDWRKLVKQINPNAYLTAEVIDSTEVLKPFLQGDEFDAVMNYNFLFAVADYFVDDKTKISTSKFNFLLKKLRNAFPEEVAFVQQNLVDSHDTQRIASFIVNKDLAKIRNWSQTFDVWKGSNPAYKTRKPNAAEIQIQKLIVIFQMTYLGAPMVYYGDEAGMWGANDPDCRKPMIWNDLAYDNELYLPDQSMKNIPDTVSFNYDLFNHYKKLIAIRNKSLALQLGNFKSLIVDDEKNIYGFSRTYKNQTAFVLLNNSNSVQNVKLSNIKFEILKDVLNETELKPANGRVSVVLKPYWGCVLINN